MIERTDRFGRFSEQADNQADKLMKRAGRRAGGSVFVFLFASSPSFVFVFIFVFVFFISSFSVFCLRLSSSVFCLPSSVLRLWSSLFGLRSSVFSLRPRLHLRLRLRLRLYCFAFRQGSALRVPPAETRLTVYRRLSMCCQTQATH